jgi:HAD superfamily hydrolase (TIGR01509 family)
MIQAIVFDFDGLVLDTETPEFHSFQELFTEHGTELTLEVWGACIGTQGGFDPYGHLETCLGRPVDRNQLRLLRKAKYDAKMQAADVRPGVRSYLQRAKELGLRIGLASSSKRAWVTGYLEQYGLLSYFDVIRTSEDVERVKPDPALYLKALESLGVPPEAAVAFEDSPNGSLAAKRAGMYCVIVPNEVTSQLPFGVHDLRMGSMADQSLDDVLGALEDRPKALNAV